MDANTDLSTAPFRDARYAPRRLDIERRGDGSLLLANPTPYATQFLTTLQALDRWSAGAPDRVWLAERSGEGWRTVTYAEGAAMVAAAAGGLKGLGLKRGDALLILARNGIDHALISYAAMSQSVAVAPVSPQYGLAGADLSRLAYACGVLKPDAVYADDAAAFAGALDADFLKGLPVVASANPRPGDVPFDSLLSAPPAASIAEPDDIAKLLLTSGSTGSPKPVLYTHGMLAQVPQINAAMLPVVTGDQVICDWLPWSHTYGSTINLHGALVNGSLFVIDQGLPIPGAFDRTADLLARVRPTFYAGVPASFMLLAERLDRDPNFAAAFFDRLIGVGFGGAALPPGLIGQLQQAAQRAAGRGLVVGGGYGMTETAGIAATVYWENSRGDLIGLPPRGVRLRLYPLGDGRYEVRVKGPNVTPGYWHMPELTAHMFDEAGFYRTGDAVLFADPDKPATGLIFGGRLAEDFKLASGTFVRVGALRLALIEALSPVVKEAIIVGENQAEPGALLVIDPVELAAQAGAEGCGGLDWLAWRLPAARIGQGGSMAISRALITTLPPDRAAGEITDKGSLNQALCRRRRAGDIAVLYAGTGAGIIYPRPRPLPSR